MFEDHPRRWLVGLLAIVLATLTVAGCEPLVNAPPGGGETVTETFRIGPFNLGPGEEAKGSPSSGMPRPAGDFGLKGARFRVVEENGDPVDPREIHLHHIVMTTSARADELCPGRRERFIASGMERTPIKLWGPYAYLVGDDDRWGSIYHLMNQTPPGTPEKTLYIEYTLDYQPGANASNSRPVTPYFLDVTGCGNSEYDVPGDGGPGSVHLKLREWRAPADGMAVYSGGHLHNGGINIRLKEALPAGQTDECKGTATYHGDPPHLMSINPCFLHERIYEGRKYRVAARYDNSRPWDDVMGIMLTYVWWGTQ